MHKKAYCVYIFNILSLGSQCAILYADYGPGHPSWNPSNDSRKIHAKVGSWTLTGSGQNNELSRFDVMPGRVLKDYSFITLEYSL